MNSVKKSDDVTILRELARRYAALARDQEQERRRRLWRRHNSLRGDRPPIYVRAFAWQEMPDAACACADPLFRRCEDSLRQRIFWHSLGDDSVFEPWVTVRAVPACAGWGVEGERLHAGVARGSFKIDYPIKRPEDVLRLRPPHHVIDEAATARNAQRLGEAIGDLIAVDIDRSPEYSFWNADLSTNLGHLRGIENVMLDMVDRPAWLHDLVGFMAAGVARAQEEAEQAGDWGLSSHVNQAMPYAEELPDPAPNARGVSRRQLWAFMAAQEFTGVSPAMHEEFLLRYQRPILERFGLCAYGCCEDLTNKIGMLRSISNLRRIAVSPFANVPRCAEQIGRDYVLSYRPSPADMVGYGFDRDRIRRILTRDLQACRGCHVDITLKDVETVEGDPTRVRRWVALCREVIEEVFG